MFIFKRFEVKLWFVTKIDQLILRRVYLILILATTLADQKTMLNAIQ